MTCILSRKRTFYTKAFESHRITDKQTEPTIVSLFLQGLSSPLLDDESATIIIANSFQDFDIVACRLAARLEPGSGKISTGMESCPYTPQISLFADIPTHDLGGRIYLPLR